MSKDYSLLPIAARLPLTGSAGDTVKMYTPCRINVGMWVRDGCDFSASSGRFGGSGLQFSTTTNRLYFREGFIGDDVSGGDFTVSFFFRTTTVARAYQTLAGIDSSNSIGLKLAQICFYASGAYQITGPTITANTWYHVALCKIGSTTTLYLNGVGTSVSRSLKLLVKYIGGNNSSSEGFAGDISEFTYANKALYSANFTPPSAAMSLDLFDESMSVNRNVGLLVRGYVASARKFGHIPVSRVMKGLAFGYARIVGTVKEAHLPSDLPLSRRVRLYRKADGQLIDETWSDAAGNYAFTNLAIQKYYVVAFDHTDNYNAVIKDSITPVL
ncbi:LamG-like jellyroll fold domain-containing protein [Undibacterium danionis]|uniref:LamG-like jellyroll fold domain-containing protein n=1 Tax=Undibacterium danionis TaxID=1812100 RepID=A0ABV6ICY0_9BURK